MQFYAEFDLLSHWLFALPSIHLGRAVYMATPLAETEKMRQENAKRQFQLYLQFILVGKA